MQNSTFETGLTEIQKTNRRLKQNLNYQTSSRQREPFKPTNLTKRVSWLAIFNDQFVEYMFFVR